MNAQTVQLLNQLNRLFYQTIARSFDTTRSRPWPGWLELLPYAEAMHAKPLKILDLGCGNGRFGLFLHEQGLEIDYSGLDSSAFLLERAREALVNHGILHHLTEADILDYEPGERFHLAVLFGVMHHVPGFENRRKLLQRIMEWLEPGGLLILTFWLFYEDETLKERIVPWDDPRVPEPYRGLAVEENDYLLDWRRDTFALRYCHYVDAAESLRLLDGVDIIADFTADKANRYVIVRRM